MSLDSQEDQNQKGKKEVEWKKGKGLKIENGANFF